MCICITYILHFYYLCVSGACRGPCLDVGGQLSRVVFFPPAPRSQLRLPGLEVATLPTVPSHWLHRSAFRSKHFTPLLHCFAFSAGRSKTNVKISRKNSAASLSLDWDSMNQKPELLNPSSCSCFRQEERMITSIPIWESLTWWLASVLNLSKNQSLSSCSSPSFSGAFILKSFLNPLQLFYLSKWQKPQVATAFWWHYVSKWHRVMGFFKTRTCKYRRQRAKTPIKVNAITQFQPITSDEKVITTPCGVAVFLRPYLAHTPVGLLCNGIHSSRL